PAKAPARTSLRMGPDAPPQRVQGLPKGFDANPLERIVNGACSELANTAPALRLLRSRHHRPHCRAAKSRDKLAPSHPSLPNIGGITAGQPSAAPAWQTVRGIGLGIPCPPLLFVRALGGYSYML